MDKEKIKELCDKVEHLTEWAEIGASWTRDQATSASTEKDARVNMELAHQEEKELVDFLMGLVKDPEMEPKPNGFPWGLTMKDITRINGDILDHRYDHPFCQAWSDMDLTSEFDKIMGYAAEHFEDHDWDWERESIVGIVIRQILCRFVPKCRILEGEEVERRRRQEATERKWEEDRRTQRRIIDAVAPDPEDAQEVPVHVEDHTHVKDAISLLERRASEGVMALPGVITGPMKEVNEAAQALLDFVIQTERLQKNYQSLKIRAFSAMYGTFIPAREDGLNHYFQSITAEREAKEITEALNALEHLNKEARDGNIAVYDGEENCEALLQDIKDAYRILWDFITGIKTRNIQNLPKPDVGTAMKRTQCRDHLADFIAKHGGGQGSMEALAFLYTTFPCPQEAGRLTRVQAQKEAMEQAGLGDAMKAAGDVFRDLETEPPDRQPSMEEEIRDMTDDDPGFLKPQEGGDPNDEE